MESASNAAQRKKKEKLLTTAALLASLHVFIHLLFCIFNHCIDKGASQVLK